MSERCSCRWYEVRIPFEPHIPPMWEAEPDPDCPTHGPAMTSNETKENERG